MKTPFSKAERLAEELRKKAPLDPQRKKEKVDLFYKKNKLWPYKT